MGANAPTAPALKTNLHSKCSKIKYVSINFSLFLDKIMNKNGSNQPHKVLVIPSSVRDGRQGAKVAQAVMKHLDSYSSLQAEILGKV